MENRPSKNVTIYDIAKRAKISPSTVGSVMNGTWKKRRISGARAIEIKKIADDMGYSMNLQASSLRKDRSRIIGMILPMHDNRYFSSISQIFEEKARARGLFPIISSTLRDPNVEEEAVRLLLNYQVERIVCTGATDPDNIAKICHNRGVQTYNLDLPGTKAPSVISDNYQGSLTLTSELINRVRAKGQAKKRIVFIGGRAIDHNTKERIRGFRDSLVSAGFEINEEDIQTCGYAAGKAEAVLDEYLKNNKQLPAGIFVNSTISLEGIIRWFNLQGFDQLNSIALGCFDWDPFAALVHPDLLMIRQNVPKMLSSIFNLIDQEETNPDILIQISPDVLF